jgi:hypothetical protein
MEEMALLMLLEQLGGIMVAVVAVDTEMGITALVVMVLLV